MRSTRLFVVLFVALLALRLPSLVQPAGSDQGLYAYVGQAITHGEVPYRDAWDQKPPAVHLAYALMYAVWPGDQVVPAADLLLAGVAAWLIFLVGRRLTRANGPGEAAALLFLLLGNPSFLRLSGMYVRAQCESFIAVLVVGALWLILVALDVGGEPGALGGWRRTGAPVIAGAGVLLGCAFTFKYNALAYLLVATVTIFLLADESARLSSDRSGHLVKRIGSLLLGFLVPVALVALWFVWTNAFRELLDATWLYNVKYSTETYGSRFGVLFYLLSFPVQHARVDSLWFLGGLGCALLIVAAFADRQRLVAPLWVAAACLSIAVNGGRGLPQYFVQALPLLALAAGLGGVLVWNALALVPRVVLVVALALAVGRVSDFGKLVANTSLDVQYWRGKVTTSQYLGRFTSDRTSAVAVNDLGNFLKSKTLTSDRVYVFGFSGGAYVHAQRLSASRFFWSRPVLVGFNEGVPGYGAAGLLEDLSAAHPPYVVLQQHDWPAEGIDSATYFLRHPRLGEWLRSRYELKAQNATYLIWARRTGT